MCTQVPVSELVKMDITWIRGDDKRLETVFSSLKGGGCITSPIQLLNCGCGKTYMLADGGHRITAAYKILKKTGRDVLIPVHKKISDYQ